jgi:hypothetical protein
MGRKQSTFPGLPSTSSSEPESGRFFIKLRIATDAIPSLTCFRPMPNLVINCLDSICPRPARDFLQIAVVPPRKRSLSEQSIFVFIVEVRLNLRNDSGIDSFWHRDPNSENSFRVQNSLKSEDSLSAHHRRGSERVNTQRCNEFIDKE